MATQQQANRPANNSPAFLKLHVLRVWPGHWPAGQIGVDVALTELSKEEIHAVGKHSAAVACTVVGARNAARWAFWAQLNEKKNGRWHIREVRRIA